MEAIGSTLFEMSHAIPFNRKRLLQAAVKSGSVPKQPNNEGSSLKIL
jgi:hypothetical protein